MHSIQRNSLDNIEPRYEWVLNWVKETDMDYMSNFAVWSCEYSATSAHDTI
jgi:hypothetical protein